jgi:hypothetical protein
MHKHASFAAGWALSRDGRTSSWVSPGGSIRIQVTLTPHEYREHPSDAAGLWGECIEWDERIYKRQDDGTWRPVTVRLGTPKQKKPKAKLKTKARHAS